MDTLTFLSDFSYSRKNVYLKTLATEPSTFPRIQSVHLFVQMYEKLPFFLVMSVFSSISSERIP